MKKLYSENDIQHEELIKGLKALPQIKAPENFEYNLMVRIQNKNFGEVLEERPKFNFVKFFAPSAIVASVILLFFIFYPPSGEVDNPLMSEPPVLDSQSVANNSNIINKQLAFKESIKQKQANVPKARASEKALSTDANSPSTKLRPPIPLSARQSVSLDDYISGSATNRTELQKGNVVKSGEEPSEFDGFFVREQPDLNTLKKYRATVDSLKKAQAKADSIKKARK